MKHLLNKLFLFLLIGIAFGCSKDSDSPSENPTVVISNLDFTITTNEENPLQVAVTPQATNATSYKIYFDSEGSDEFQTTTGSLVTHTYPELSATYKIKVEASAPNAQDIELVKNHVVTVVEATNIADFETQSPPYIIDGDVDGKIEASVVASPDSNNTTSVLKVTNVGELYEAVTIVNTKHIKLTSKKVISLDFYQEEAASPILLLKLEGNATEGGFDVEVPKTALATAGWQTIEFDFNDAVNSYPNNEDPTVTLNEYQKVVIFIGFGQAEYAGDYYIDNVKGAEFGENQSDVDGDSVIDAIDKCPDTAGSTDNKGCPAGPSASASNPSLDASEVMSIYSDYYSENPTVTTYQTSWSANCTIENLAIDSGNSVLKTSVLAENGYAGIEFASAFDVSTYNTIHMDVWSPDMTDFRFKLEGTGAIEATVAIDKNNEWVSIDLPISSFATATEGVLSDIKLAVLSAAKPGQVYIDNIYLYTSDQTEQSSSLKVSVSVPEGTTSVRLTGPWWGWNPTGGPVAVDNEDGTWTVTFETAPTENMEYLWVVEGTQENLIDNAAGGECTSKVDAGTLITDYANYANRVWILGSGDVSNVYDSCE
ncbi:hypothetical protein N8136_03355 [Flavobacteriaceae bacterium]|nr:hypothetical protein [Flavobacteriaceae bacterium]MDC1496253.1 hypothetical protein [Flavobacteriaceae bacterium]